MKSEDAKLAIDLDKDEYLDGIGYWSHTESIFEDARLSSVAHFWPIENESKYKAVFPDGKYVRVKRHISSCGVSDTFNSIPHTSDLYTLRKLPKCKKCLAKLIKIAKTN